MNNNVFKWNGWEKIHKRWISHTQQNEICGDIINDMFKRKENDFFVCIFDEVAIVFYSGIFDMLASRRE